MSKIKELQDAMVAAMKAKDKFRKDSIAALVSAVKKVGIDNGCREDIPDDMANQAILKEMKAVKEQMDTCPKERAELLEEYTKRYEIMTEFDGPLSISINRNVSGDTQLVEIVQLEDGCGDCFDHERLRLSGGDGLFRASRKAAQMGDNLQGRRKAYQPGCCRFDEIRIFYDFT